MPTVRTATLLLTTFCFTAIVGLSVWYGWQSPLTECSPTSVPIIQTWLHNLALYLILETGLFTLGIGTIVASMIILPLTSVGVGAVISGLGLPGLLLLLPHGALEYACMFVAVTVGLTPLSALTGSSAKHGKIARFPGKARITVTYKLLVGAQIFLVVVSFVAAVIESWWGASYGSSVSCVAR